MINVDYSLTYDCLHIEDSYKVRKWNMRKTLKEIRDTPQPGQTIVFERCLTSLKLEWICHNFLYNIGYERERTKDVDLDNPCDRPEWEYIVCGILVWLVVW